MALVASAASPSGVALVIEQVERLRLRGGTDEFDPYAGVWATWGRHAHDRVMRHARDVRDAAMPVIVPLPPLPSATAGEWRGDEAVWLRLYAHTRHSGFDTIDAEEGEYTRWDVKEGAVRIPLRDLLGAVVEGGQSVTRPFVSRILALALWDEASSEDEDGVAHTIYSLGETQLLKTSKASVRVRLVLRGDATAAKRALRELDHATAAAERRGLPLYGTVSGQEAARRMRNLLVRAYVSMFIGRDGVAARVPIGADATMLNLHLLEYVSTFGMLPVYAFFQHDAAMRQPCPGASCAGALRDARDDGLDESTEAVLGSMLRSALRRHGFTPELFVEAVHEILDVYDRAATQPPVMYYETYRAVCNTASNVAHGTQYSMDIRIRPLDDVREETKLVRALPTATKVTRSRPTMGMKFGCPACQAKRLEQEKKEKEEEEDEKKGKAKTLDAMALCGNCHGRRHRRHWRRGPHHLGDKEGGALVVTSSRKALMPVESFDTDTTCGMGKTNDCEDSNNITSTTARVIARGRVLDRARGTRGWRDPVLEAARRLLRLHVVLDTAASVTEAYASDNVREKGHAGTELPRIGDARDMTAEVEGHGVGLGVPRVLVADWLRRGGVNVDRELPEFVTPDGEREWLRRVGVYVLEGTGPVDGWIVPAASMVGDGPEAAAFVAKAAARKRFIDLVGQDATLKRRFLARLTSELLSYHVQAPSDARTRISSFYRGIAQASCADLAAVDPRYAMLVVADARTRRRGLPIDDLAYARDNVALIPHYTSVVSADAWRREVDPVVAMIQNQQPEMAYLRASADTHVAAKTTAVASLNAGVGRDDDTTTTTTGTVANAAGIRDTAGYAKHLGCALKLGPRHLGVDVEEVTTADDDDDATTTTTTTTTTTPWSDRIMATFALPQVQAVRRERLTNAVRDASVAVVRFRARPWQLNAPGAREDLDASLAALVRDGHVVAYEWTLDAPLPHTLGDDPSIVAHLTLLVPTGK